MVSEDLIREIASNVVMSKAGKWLKIYDPVRRKMSQYYHYFNGNGKCLCGAAYIQNFNPRAPDLPWNFHSNCPICQKVVRERVKYGGRPVA
jgi:hypothetical protein